MTVYRTTDEQFEAVKDEARKWIEYFGLSEWEIFFRCEHMENLDQARCYANIEGKVCTLELARWQGEACMESEIRKSAFHEVCELLLREMECLALDSDIPCALREKFMIAAKHGVIRRLENSLYRRSKEEA